MQPLGLPGAAVADADVDPRETILDVRNLRTSFPTAGGFVHAVDNVSFSVRKREAPALVGESGCGKSVTAMSIMRLVAPPGRITAGEVRFKGKNLADLSERDMRTVRGNDSAMVFQEPMTSLNPVFKIGFQVAEAIRIHKKVSKKEAWKQAGDMLELVSIPDPIKRLDDYPHQLSGGMRQRVMIAMALSCEPELLIADEPTTALDVTIQAQILELIKKLKQETGASVILITHDLGVVAGMTDDIVVMYAGKVFEQAPTRELFAAPGNPYTKGLLRSVPDPLHEEGTELYQIPGLPPDVVHLPTHQCPFAERCYRVEDICRRELP